MGIVEDWPAIIDLRHFLEKHLQFQEEPKTTHKSKRTLLASKITAKQLWGNLPKTPVKV